MTQNASANVTDLFTILEDRDYDMSEATTSGLAPKNNLSDQAFLTFFRISNAWKLTEDEQLGLLGAKGATQFQEWKQGRFTNIYDEVLERISCILGINVGLRMLLSQTRDDWVHQPNENKLFGGEAPLKLMTSGNFADLQSVRQYVEEQL